MIDREPLERSDHGAQVRSAALGSLMGRPSLRRLASPRDPTHHRPQELGAGASPFDLLVGQASARTSANWSHMTSMRKDFIDEARLSRRIVLNVGDASLPPPIDTATIHRYNRQFAQRIYRYAHQFAPPLRAFLQENMPQLRPATVVFPFGGGDLISALLAFPDAPELSTISLEQAGDPRRINSITPQAHLMFFSRDDAR